MLTDTSTPSPSASSTFVSEHDAERQPDAATSVLIAIPVSVVFFLVQKNLVTGLTAGGTKG